MIRRDDEWQAVRLTWGEIATIVVLLTAACLVGAGYGMVMM